jgi:hypothetical protein
MAREKDYAPSKICLALICYALVYLTLAFVSYTKESATYDEAVHLTAGYATLSESDYRIDPTHPPLARMWSALPLLLLDVRLDKEIPEWKRGDWWEISHAFVFAQNDADTLLFSSRFMIALLGCALGVLLFAWARILFNSHTAFLVLGMYAFEPTLFSHARYVTTDMGLTVSAFTAVFSTWLLFRLRSWPRAAFFLLAWACLPLSKFSGVLFLPVLGCAFVWRGLSTQPWPGKLGFHRLTDGAKERFAFIAALCMGLALVFVFLVWACYGFHYRITPADAPPMVFNPLPQSETLESFWLVLLNTIDQYRLLPNAFTQGFLAALVETHRGGYLLGEQGHWWYYYPFAMWFKAPGIYSVLALFFVVFFKRFDVGVKKELFFLGSFALFFIAFAMTRSINLGVRHVLPIYPFIILGLGAVLHYLLAIGRSKVSWALVVVLALEFAGSYPQTISFFSPYIGGSVVGHQYLTDSNLDWGQGLKNLEAWMGEHGVEHVNLSYYGTADPGYYNIPYTPFGQNPFSIKETAQEMRLPGYVAVSVSHLSLNKDGQYNFLRAMIPEERLDGSIWLYWLEKMPGR